MVDAQNNPIQVGDFVAYMQNANTNPHLSTGNVQKIYQNQKACTIDGYTNIRASRILKINGLKEK